MGEKRKSQPSGGNINISNISGGTFTAGDVTAGSAGGNVVTGDVNQGDVVGRDQISGNTQTEAVPADAAQAALETALIQWTMAVEAKIEHLTALVADEKEDLKAQTVKVKAEAAKGVAADAGKLERLLNTMSVMSPDILEVTATLLQNPFAGVGLVLHKINDRVKLERGKK